MGKLGYIFRCIAHMDYGALFQTVGDCHDKSGEEPRMAVCRRGEVRL